MDQVALWYAQVQSVEDEDVCPKLLEEKTNMFSVHEALECWGWNAPNK